MSNNTKTIGVVVIVALVVVGGWLFVANQQSSLDQTATQPAADMTASANRQNQDTRAQNGQGSISPTDTSDTALVSDMTSVDAQMSALGSDSAKADQTQ